MPSLAPPFAAALGPFPGLAQAVMALVDPVKRSLDRGERGRGRRLLDTPAVDDAIMGRSSIQANDADDATLRCEIGRLVGRACPAWAASQREDIVQAAMIRILRVRAQRRDEGPLPRAYLWKVAYSATIDELRRLRAQREVPLDDEGREVVDPRGLGPERDAQATEISTKIRAALARLKDERRQAVTLYLQGHSVPEAGRLLGWSTKRTENLVYRGLADLRALLSSEGVTP